MHRITRRAQLPVQLFKLIDRGLREAGELQFPHFSANEAIFSDRVIVVMVHSLRRSKRKSNSHSVFTRQGVIWLSALRTTTRGPVMRGLCMANRSAHQIPAFSYRVIQLLYVPVPTTLLSFTFARYRILIDINFAARQHSLKSTPPYEIPCTAISNHLVVGS